MGVKGRDPIRAPGCIDLARSSGGLRRSVSSIIAQYFGLGQWQLTDIQLVVVFILVPQ